MQLELAPHPNFQCHDFRLEACIERVAPAAVSLNYRLSGDTRSLRFPRQVESARRDGLWRHSCFELFVNVPGRDQYFEINLSPSHEWAAYAFDRYREGMRPIAIADPQVHARLDETGLALRAKVDFAGAADLPADRPWRIGLSAVIEDMTGTKSYWALAHPPGPADFHHEDCFALELPAAQWR